MITISDLKFSWSPTSDPVLNIPFLQIQTGDRVFIEGPSGSGKTTLLSLLAGVITPQEGTITLLDQQINTMKGAQRDRFRADHIGFIFQLFNLIPYLSVLENVILPCWFSPLRRQRVQHSDHTLASEALRLLTHLDLASSSVLNRAVTELSVGQQQRVAAARALIGSPEIVIADEPTSALDRDRREAFIRLIFSECEQAKTTLIFVSHDRSLAPLFDRMIRLQDLTIWNDA